MTLYADTRNFHYAIEVEDLTQLRRNLRKQYEELIGFAEGHCDDARLDRQARNAMLKSLAGWWETVDAIEEAVDPLDDDHKAAVLLLIQQVIGEASAIARAEAMINVQYSLHHAGTEHARSAQTTPERETAIALAIRQCPLGERKPAHWVSARLEREGFPLKPEAVKDRMKKMGVWQTLRDAAVGVCQTPTVGE